MARPWAAMARLLLALSLLWAPMALAQGSEPSIDDDDGGRGYLTGLLEGLLSDDETTVRIDGFEGALSTRATIQRLRISDSQGAWLTLEGLVFDWDRSALFGRELVIQELSAERVVLDRMPVSDRAPEATSTDFSFPQLPVAVRIDRIGIGELDLGEAILEGGATLTAEGSVALDGGEGSVRLAARRTDGQRGVLSVQAIYDEAQGTLGVDARFDEGEGGIAASALGIPGTPSVVLTVTGAGPIDDFSADIRLATDGSERLSGTVELEELGDTTGDEAVAQRVTVDLAGDLAPLFAPEYEDFFGNAVTLRVIADRLSDGALRLHDLTVEAAAVSLSGTARVAADGLPEAFDLRLRIDDPGEPVLMPLPTEVYVEGADLEATFDERDGERWSLVGELLGVNTPGLDLDRLDIEGGGTITRGDTRAVTAVIDAAVRGLRPADPGLALALGQDVILDAALSWEDGAPVTFESFSLAGQGYELAGDGQLLLANLAVIGLAEARFDDVSRLSTLAGRSLGGSLSASVEGRADLLGGGFDLRLEGEGRDLTTGIETADALLGGTADLVVDAVRNTEGTRIRLVSVETEALSALVTGLYAEEGSRLSFDAGLDDVGRVLPQLSGPVTLVGTARQMRGRWSVGLEAEAPSGARATVFAVLPEDGRVSVDLDASVEDVTPFVPQLSGPGTVTASVARIDGGWRVDADLDVEPGVSAELRGAFVTEGLGQAEYAASIADLSVLDPGLSGALSVEGTATTEAGGFVARARLDGPGGLEGTVTARRDAPPAETEGVPAAPVTVRFDLAVDDPEEVYPLPDALRVPGPVAARGTLELGAARRLDLTLDGPYGIAATLGAALPSGEGLDGLVAEYDVTAPDVALLPYVPETLGGEARARGRVTVEGEARRATLDLDGPAGIEADVTARMEGDAVTADYDVRAADVSRLPYVPEGLDGPARARGTASVSGGLRRIVLDLDGPEGIAAEVTASLPEGGGLAGLAAEFDIAVADLAALPGVPPEAGGRATARGRLAQGEDGRTLEATLTAPLGIEAEVTASQPPDAAGLEGLVAELDLTTGDLSALLGVPEAGAARAVGRVSVEGDLRRLSFEMDGPIGLTARLDGSLPAGSSVEGLDGTFSASLPDLARLPGLPEGLEGPAAVAGAFAVEDGVLRADASLDGPVTGEVEVSRPLDARGLAGLGLAFDLEAPDLAAFPGVPDALSGPASAEGRVSQEGGTRTLVATLDAPLGITARIEAEQPADAEGLDGATASFDASTDDLSPLLGLPDGAAGAVRATGRLGGEAGARRLTAQLDGPFGIVADIEADLPDAGTDGIAATYRASVPDIGALPGVPEGFAGASQMRGTVAIEDGATRIAAFLDGPFGLDGEVTAELRDGQPAAEVVYDFRLPDLAAIPAVPAQLSGPARIDGVAQSELGTWTTDFGILAPAGIDLQGAAVFDEGGTLLAGLSGTVAEPGAIRPGIPGPVTVEASVRMVDGELTAEVTADAPEDAMLRATARLGPSGDADIAFEANLGRPDRLAPQLRGPLTAEGSARRRDGTWRVDADVVTGGGSSALVNASLAPDGTAEVSADVRLGDLGRFVRQLPGALTARVDARRRGGTWVADVSAQGPALGGSARITLPPSGQISGTFDVRLDRLDRFDDRLTGGIAARGTLAQAGDRIVLSAGLRGPGTLDARVSGSVARDLRSADLRARGTAPLGLASPFIPPRLIEGDARFDLTLNGPFALRSLRGTVSTAGARLALPKFRIALTGISADIRLTGTRAVLDVSGGASTGGSFALSGPIELAPNFPAELSLRLDGIGIRDPQLYETTADADLRVTGPILNGGGTVSGQVTLAETEIRIPGRGFGSTGAIPVIEHVGAALDVRETLERARLDAASRSGAATNRDGTPSRNFFNLDIRISAERRIFVRGRGLDAELGGSLRITGTTRDIRPSGSFVLIRGRIDLLGRRLTLDEGSITLQGDFVPVVRLVASTRTEEGIVSLVVEGDLTSPEIRFESETGLPQDEVVARLLFGQGLGSLTPLQAARLANAVAVLSGSGLSVTDNIRERLGLDNLDVVIDDEGLFGVTAGKYVRDDVYTSVTVDEQGEAEIEIEIDLTDELIVRGSVNDRGDTGIGLFFERDY